MDYDLAMYGSVAGSAAPVAAGLGIGYVIFMLAFAAVELIAMWKIFTKAGVAGWKCLIPFYNIYCLLQIVGKPTWWMAMILLVPIANVIFGIMMLDALAKAFGKSTGFTLGLIFLSPIFTLILGFGKDKYVLTPAQT